jgi:predicted dehydrogenase
MMRRNAGDRIGWGILGAGRISHTFALALRSVPDADLVAIGSRSRQNASAFGEQLGIGKRHGSFEALLDDPEVDVVYVGVPHPFHAEWAAKALEAGKAVLCEKPLTVNAREARRLVAVARRTGRFLMEAMTARFVPCMVRAREIAVAGMLGDIRFLVADMGGRPPNDAGDRWSSPELGGGSLLDLGVYPVSLAWNFLGRPSAIRASATMGPTGVDLSCSIMLEYPGGERAILASTLEAQTAASACIAGTEARLEFDGRMNCPQGARLMTGEQLLERLPVFPHSTRTRFVALEVGRCLREGLLESPAMPLDESVAIMETLDEIRRQIALRYPFEQPGEAPTSQGEHRV